MDRADTISHQNWEPRWPTALTVSDKDEELGFRLEPRAGLRARRRLGNAPRVARATPSARPVGARPFQVVGESAGAEPPPGVPRSVAARAGVPDPGRPVLDGGIQHLPILSKGVIVLAGLLVVAIAGLVVAGMRTSAVPGARIRT